MQRGAADMWNKMRPDMLLGRDGVRQEYLMEVSKKDCVMHCDQNPMTDSSEVLLQTRV